MSTYRRQTLISFLLLSLAACGNEAMPASEFSSIEQGLLTPVLQASAGIEHSCAVRPDGIVKCWGNNSAKKLGTLTPLGSSGFSATPVNVAQTADGLSAAFLVQAGYQHTCAIHQNGDVYCWGQNTYGQLGVGDTTDRATPTKVAFPAAAPCSATRLSAGLNYSCAVCTDRSVRCWGSNYQGQLGKSDLPVGTTAAYSTPVKVDLPASETAIDISGGYETTCTGTSSGKVYCWGGNKLGQAKPKMQANGLCPTCSGPATCSSPTPTQVDLGGSAMTTVPTFGSMIATATNHSCAVLQTGAVRCWGQPQQGRLGVGVYSDDPFSEMSCRDPQVVDNLDGSTSSKQAFSVATGEAFSCASTRDRRGKCWGANDSGQLGAGIPAAPSSPRFSPVDLSLGTNSIGGVSANRGIHACAVSNTGDTLLCWGGDGSGRLGDDSVIASQNAPVAVHASLFD